MRDETLPRTVMRRCKSEGEGDANSVFGSEYFAEIIICCAQVSFVKASVNRLLLADKKKTVYPPRLLPDVLDVRRSLCSYAYELNDSNLKSQMKFGRMKK